MRAAAILIAGLALLATASAGRDLVSSRSLLQTAGIESVADAVAQQPVVPQMVSPQSQSKACAYACNAIAVVAPSSSVAVLPLGQPWCRASASTSAIQGSFQMPNHINKERYGCAA